MAAFPHTLDALNHGRGRCIPQQQSVGIKFIQICRRGPGICLDQEDDAGAAMVELKFAKRRDRSIPQRPAVRNDYFGPMESGYAQHLVCASAAPDHFAGRKFQNRLDPGCTDVVQFAYQYSGHDFALSGTETKSPVSVAAAADR